MVEVYRTNIEKKTQAKMVLKKLKQKFPHFRINFDLEDCDNILRVDNVTKSIDSDMIIHQIQEIGFWIEVLPDTPSICDLENSQSVANYEAGR